ncbi:MAG: flagellar hook-associated protein FlgL [Planctomycetes bacterium]|nr:flagellar hook-associated protein FlgL [Planctomycetota bacterium]
MSFRVTQSLSADAANRQVQATFAKLFRSQQTLSSGKKVSKPSDDPSSIGRLLQFKERSRELERFERNAGEGRAFVDSSASFLEDVSARIIDARVNVIQGITGSLTQSDRDTIATTLDGIIEDMVSLANSRVANRYVFAGTASDRQPYRLVTDPSGAQRVQYDGNSDRLVAEVGPGVQAAFNVPGELIFGAGPRGATTFSGLTGVASGTGTDNGTGTDQLILSHGVTSYGGGGLAPGASSPALDTVLGGSHLVHVKITSGSSSGLVSLNGGPDFAFQLSDADLKVVGPDGETAFLDLRGVISPMDADVSLSATGSYSLDGGATSSPIDFTSANQQVVDSHTGAILNLDSTAVRRAGNETVSFGAFGLFDALISLRDGLRNVGTDGSLPADDLKRLNGSLAELDKSHDRMLSQLGVLGGLSARLQNAEVSLGDLGVRLAELTSKIEDVDLAEAVIALQQNETAYQSALLVTSRVNELSLLNFI